MADGQARSLAACSRVSPLRRRRGVRLTEGSSSSVCPRLSARTATGPILTGAGVPVPRPVP